MLIRALEPINGKDLMATNRSKKRKNPNSKPIKDTDLCNGPSKVFWLGHVYNHYHIDVWGNGLEDLG